jgi:hypothetical protein
MSDDRLERLEARVEVLEKLVRQLAAARGPSATSATPPAATPSTPVEPSPRFTAPPPPPSSLPRPSARPSAPPVRAPVISEQWLGQKGLLAVGVVFVVLAAGYLLKLSFDRGWISPLARCTGGAVAGVAVGVVGWRLFQRGLRTYGAALTGTGAAIIYLAAWGAARLYQFLPPTQGVVALALISAALAAVAWAVNVQVLGATAVLGGLFAPLVIGQEAGSANTLLLYLGGMGAGLGWVASDRRWRLTMFLLALSFFGIAAGVAADDARPFFTWAYGILGGAAGLYVGLRESWPETRLLAFTGGWSLLGIADQNASVHWPNLVGGVVLVAPVWWRAWRFDLVWPPTPAGPGTELVTPPATREVSWGESFYFYLSPVLLGAALWSVARDRFLVDPGLVPALVAIPYLLAGYQRERRAFATVAALALGFAAVRQTDQLGAVWMLLGLAHLWALADHAFTRSDGRWYAAATFAAAVYHMVAVNLPACPSDDPAFTGACAVTIWLAVGTAVVLAAWLIRDDDSDGPIGLRALLWATAGVILFVGVSGELIRVFHQGTLPAATAQLAGGLAVSAWWILFAAGCFLAGFRRGIRALRFAGFFVAGLALVKVVFVDLSTLDALYRVGSALILGLVSLAVAYAYHRPDKRG